MTFLEKAMERNPNIKLYGGRPSGCPYEYGYEEDYDCDGVACLECWNREMPDTEEKADVSFTDDLLNTGYNKGLKDVWELVRKLYDNTCKENEKIFDEECSFWSIIRDFTPQEALAKLKAYEEAQIEVGDVVLYKNEGNELLITTIYGNSFDGIKTKEDEFGRMGEAYYSKNLCDCKKTGKHIDISSILEQIGE